MAMDDIVNELILDDIFSVYNTAEQVMLQKLANSVKRGAMSGWSHDKTVSVQQVVGELERTIGALNNSILPATSRAILQAYIKGINSANNDLGMPTTTLKEMLQIPYHIQRLILDANNIIRGASVQILRATSDAYRSIVADSASILLTGVETPIESAQRALNAFAAKGITSFVDKAGRQWEMSSYVNMALRTASSRAALQGHIDRSLDLGHDLMIVSHFGRTCPICAPWEGVVLSISGRTPGYKRLADARAAGLFHPNCKHTLLAYFPGITKIPKTTNDDEHYRNTQIQRYNERQIRKYKRLEAVALTTQAALSASSKVSKWQAIQRKHINETGLTRRYARETPRSGVASNAVIGRQTIKLDDVGWKVREQQIIDDAIKGKKPRKPRALKP